MRSSAVVRGVVAEALFGECTVREALQEKMGRYTGVGVFCPGLKLTGEPFTLYSMLFGHELLPVLAI